VLTLKRHSAERLPPYMIADQIHLVDGLPRTRNGKVEGLDCAALSIKESFDSNDWTALISRADEIRGNARAWLNPTGVLLANQSVSHEDAFGVQPARKFDLNIVRATGWWLWDLT